MRRTDPRVESSDRLVLRFTSASSSEACQAEGWTLNSSRGGVRIISEDKLELGQELTVETAEGGAARPGRIVWVQDEPDGCIVGIAYLDVTTEAPPAP